MTTKGEELLAAARAIAPAIVEDRRTIHSWPELAYQEERTAALVATRLRDLGLEVQTGVAKTGVIGLLRGGQPGKTVLLRADMDALPIEERSSEAYVSQNSGVMHACGHDGHTAMLLGVARLLSERRKTLRGDVKFMFQPAEEGGFGALRMIEAGLLENPRVDGAFALHVGPSFWSGEVAVEPGPAYAASDRFTIKIIGRSGHAARPYQAVDPIAIVGQVLTALQTITSREVNPAENAVVTVGRVVAGTTFNVIPDEAQILGTARSYTEAVQDLLARRIGEIARGVARAMRGDAEVEYVRGYPPVINHEVSARLVREAVIESIGEAALAQDEAIMGGEDFAYVLQRVPGAMFRLGVRKGEWEEVRPAHSSSFDLDEEALPIGAAVMATTALRFLEGN